MANSRPFPAHDFITIRDTFNRWRAENAPHLTRDEAIRFALGEWLTQSGYLPPPQPGTQPQAPSPRPKPAVN